jgi:hypothetical protein
MRGERSHNLLPEEARPSEMVMRVSDFFIRYLPLLG